MRKIDDLSGLLDTLLNGKVAQVQLFKLGLGSLTTLAGSSTKVSPSGSARLNHIQMRTILINTTDDCCNTKGAHGIVKRVRLRVTAQARCK